MTDLLSKLLTADVSTREAARLMSFVEDDHEAAEQLLNAPAPAGAMLLGITGPPGCGKSTLTDALIAHRRAKYPGRKIGVVAVDPSSPRSGGAFLGDRIRMMRHSDDPEVFIRSMATRGHLGGLARHALAVARVMQHLGCNLVILETVGVGQNEVEVAGVADRVLLVLAPGAGDGIQMLKAGLMEIGDTIVINKADLGGAETLKRELLAALQLQRRDVPVAMVSALNNQGIEQLV